MLLLTMTTCYMLKKSWCYDYIAYMDIWFMYMQFFGINLYGFQIRDDKENWTFNDA